MQPDLPGRGVHDPSGMRARAQGSGRASGLAPRGRRRAVGLAAAGLILLTGCSAGDPPPPAGTPSAAEDPVVVGAGPTEQTRMVAEVWTRHLQRSGLDAELREVEGGRDGYVRAVADGGIDVYPDLTGDLSLQLTQDERAEATAAATARASAAPTPSGGQATGSATPTTEPGLVDSLAALLGQQEGGVTDEDVEQVLAQELPDGVSALEPAAADDGRRLAVTAATAAQLPSTSLEELSEQCDDLVFGGLHGQDQAAVTASALDEAYDCRPAAFRRYPTQDDVVEALLDGEIQVGVVTNASPVIRDSALTLLEDGRDALMPQRVVPVAGEDLPQAAQEALREVDERLDTEALALLDRLAVASSPLSPAESADYWLTQAGL